METLKDLQERDAELARQMQRIADQRKALREKALPLARKLQDGDIAQSKVCERRRVVVITAEIVELSPNVKIRYMGRNVKKDGTPGSNFHVLFNVDNEHIYEVVGRLE